MALNEFELIREYFATSALSRADVVLGIGDDAALCLPAAGSALAVSADTLIAGVHFPHATAPRDIGWKALAVNLSDMAAMGAEPLWFTLALTLPRADAAWLGEFSAGLAELAGRYHTALIGGDTTRGPLSITINIFGQVAAEDALSRGGARPGDGIYVTGCLGDAGLGLRTLGDDAPVLPAADSAYARARLNRPQPRVETGLALRGIASAAIDISDGLRADLGHILDNSRVGAYVDISALPLSDALRRLPGDEAYALALGAGDDYELCFCVPPAREPCLAEMDAVTRIGTVEAEAGIRGLAESGKEPGYRHF